MKILLLVAIFTVPLLILGMFGNLNLIYVTWKFKDLQNRNSLLVAIIAVCDFVIFFFAFLVLKIKEINFFIVHTIEQFYNIQCTTVELYYCKIVLL